MNILLSQIRYLLFLNPATYIFVIFTAYVHILISKQQHHCYLHRSLQAWLLQLTLPESQLSCLQLVQNSLARVIVRACKYSHNCPSLQSLHWIKIREIRLQDTFSYLQSPYHHPTFMILSLFNLITALVPLMLSLLLVHLYIPLWKSATAPSAMPHLVSGNKTS